jgi:cytochrome c oxidase subunit 4
MVTDTSQSQGTEPITGYKGMMVQSKSKKDIGSGEKLNDE